MPIATTVVGDLGAITVDTLCNVTAERRRPAMLDGRHDFELAKAQMARLGMTPGRTMIAENIRDFQR